MNARIIVPLAVVVGLAAILVPAVVAASPTAKPAAAPAMDQQAMMELYKKAGTPGPEHEAMAKLVGDWKLDVTSWMAPGAPPEKSTGTAKFELLLGGRYLQQTVHGDMGGQPYDGIGIEGFDNVTKESFSVWFDSMSTGTMLSRGKCPVEAKTCIFTGTVNDPLTGKATKVREVITRNGDNSFTFDMHGPDPKTGKEFHMVQIVYTRQ